MSRLARKRLFSLALLAATLALDPAALAGPKRIAKSDHAPRHERAWTMHIDNDLFAFADRDRDYTAGMAFTFGGEADEAPVKAPARALEWLDNHSGFDALLDDGAVEGHALEIGLLLFTPQNLAAQQPVLDDRPYANLTYASVSRVTHDARRGVAQQSSLTAGLMGLELAERLHRGVHEAVGSAEPMGYAHEISARGEPTFRYAMSRYRLLTEGVYRGVPYSLRLGTDVSLGYLTEVAAEISLRWGSTSMPWWSTPPASSDYAGHPPVGALRSPPAGQGAALLLETGIKLRARLHNSFLQGQLRDSPVTYSSSELNHLLLEAWFGLTAVLKNDWSVSYTVRHQTEEIETGSGARALTWASISVARQF